MAVEIFSAAKIGFSSNVEMPSMLSENDRALYYDLARSYQGDGAVIEVGPWLGSGTYQIARGLEESGVPWSLTVFDRFKWASLYESRYPEMGLKTGDDFLPLFRKNLKPYIDRIRPIAGEVGEINKLLPLERDIELLFVDAPKNWQLLRGVLEHVRTHMPAGSKLVFQDFFHITSRQIIWLLMSIPQLRLTRILDFGSSVVFTVDAPIPPLDTILPSDLEDLSVSDLMKMWQRLRHEFPEQRSGGLAAGMALDLLARNAVDEALAVLDEGAVGKPWQYKVADDLNRLIRPKGKDRDSLIAIGAYLRAGIHPRETRAAQERVAAEERDLKARGTEAADTLSTLERKQLRTVAGEIRMPSTPASLAVRHAYENGSLDARLFTVFICAVRSHAIAWPLQMVDLIAGKDVVEINSGTTLHGLVIRSLGARSYVGIDPDHNPERSTYTSHSMAGSWKTKFPIGDVCGMLDGLSYVSSADELGEEYGAGVVLASPEAGLDKLEQTLDEAARLLPADGTLVLHWRNPQSWSGHGRAPQLAAEFDAKNRAHLDVADWAHLDGDAGGHVTVEQLREAVESRFKVVNWEEQMEDPEAMLRLTTAVRRRLPDQPLRNYLTKGVLVTAKVGKSARAPRPRRL